MYSMSYSELAPALRTGDLLLYNTPEIPDPEKQPRVPTFRERMRARFEVAGNKMCELMHALSASVGFTDNQWNSVYMMIAFRPAEALATSQYVVSYTLCEGETHASFCFVDAVLHMRAMGVRNFAIRPLLSPLGTLPINYVDESINLLNQDLEDDGSSRVADSAGLVKELLWLLNVANVDVHGHADERESPRITIGSLFSTGGVIDESMRPNFAYAPEIYGYLGAESTKVV
jgi:hypothetical protein